MKNETLSALIDNFGPTTQYLLLGDTDHDNSGIANAVSSPKSLAAMKQAGFENLMIEYFENSRSIFDAYADHKITRDQFTDLLKHTTHSATSKARDDDLANWAADLIDNAREVGLRIIPVDGNEGYHNAPLQNERNRRSFSRLADMASQSPDLKITRSLYLETLDDVRAEMMADGSHEELRYKRKRRSEQTEFEQLDEFQKRMAMDQTSLAPRIHALAEGKPSVVFYGNWHISKKMDVDETLKILHEKDNPTSTRSSTTVINIYGENDSLGDAGMAEIRGFCREFECAVHPEHINLYLKDSDMDMGNKGFSPSLSPAPTP
ncbi:MAG TPA: hypothetical protein PKI93_02745 [Alphaproteobacteria bacterium]|nr:hypothetical protein [Alphaproteobacteria bacterium]HNS44932.1 hypothetical protein [Alphaproteobacteria bacterium]